MKTIEELTLDFEQEPPSQKTKMISGQTSQRGIQEISKLIDKGIIEYTEHEERRVYHIFLFIQDLMEQVD